jgi:ribonucleoside-diphosphate reductase alpha chain
VEKYEPNGFALKIFKDRYAIHPEETFQQACERVSNHISSAELGEKRDFYKQQFCEILSTNRFSPGGRIWRGSGRPRGQLLNCFVVPAEDSREGWGQALSDVTIISGTGGGVGLNFSRIRPRGTPIRGTGGEATGAVSLMRAINAVCNELREGGGRRSALMFCLNYDHPDLQEFMEAKLDKGELNNANISVCIDENFLKLLDENEEIILKWKGEEKGRIPAKEVWQKIVQNSLESGDPGLLNIGLANEMNSIEYIASLTSTNPCGEIWLSPYDCCCLGAVNLSTHVINGEIEWDTLEETVALSVRFLDDVIDQNHYPLPIIEETCQKHRRIGLGVMGLHDMLLKLGVKYSGEKARELIDSVMTFVKKRAYDTSIELAIEKGGFHSIDREKHVKVAGTTSGIEPIFQTMYWRIFNEHKNIQSQDREKSRELIIHPLAEQFVRSKKSLRHFESAHEISPENHLAIQEICQKHIDNSISKTINLPSDYSEEQLSKTMRKFINTLKGITIYRDGSKGQSPLVTATLKEVQKNMENLRAIAMSEDCPSGACEVS